MEIATKLSAEVSSRAHEPPGPEARGSGRVSPETSGETQVARTIPPPYFNL